MELAVVRIPSGSVDATPSPEAQGSGASPIQCFGASAAVPEYIGLNFFLSTGLGSMEEGTDPTTEEETTFLVNRLLFETLSTTGEGVEERSSSTPPSYE